MRKNILPNVRELTPIWQNILAKNQAGGATSILSGFNMAVVQIKTTFSIAKTF
ncbi:MAG: hypothetical protein HY840_06010 [Bacteroidetes bacterium]|nr:hypothetical protein [Bacteroidota bacterium]